MNEIIETQLEWKYTPDNYIEEAISFCHKNCSVNINSGQVIAKISPEIFKSSPNLSNELTEVIDCKFATVQLMSHKEYSLSSESRTDITKNGNKHYYVHSKITVMSTVTCKVDVVLHDKDGNILSDSKQERLEKQKWFSRLVQKNRSSDSTLDSMLTSYKNSVHDPENELVHLYEIRDALSQLYGSKKEATDKLGLKNKDWDYIGYISNNQPLKEGRHRGKSQGHLRKATTNELNDARKSAVNLVEKYLIYLDTTNN